MRKPLCSLASAISCHRHLYRHVNHAKIDPEPCACLQPLYPGQTHRIRRNLLNFVLAVDLGSPEGLGAAAAAHSLHQQQLPVRWGILPLNTSLRIGVDDGVRPTFLSRPRVGKGLGLYHRCPSPSALQDMARHGLL